MNNTLTLSRTYSYSVEKVFSKYSDPDAIARWWGPRGFSNSFTSFDFSEGGNWIFTMHDEKSDYYNEMVFRTIGEDRIVMEHIVEPIFTLEVLLEEIRENETKMTWISTFANPDFLTQMTDFLIEKNHENFDRLGEELADFS